MSQDQLDMEFGYDLIDNGTSDDYYTPPWLFQALNVEFDLDVCAPAGGVPWIPAKRSLSIIDDGLNTDWHGRVWMNPPYSAPTPWIDKFIEHGNGICLIACSRSGSFYKLWDMADAFMGLPMPLIKFVTAGGESKGIFMPVILAAMGATNVEVMRDSKLSRVR
jgi:hypothetical protein